MSKTDVENKTKSKNKRWIKLGVAMLLGAGAGFAYYSFIGCSTGGCPITSSPYISTAYGAVFGAVFGWS